MNHKSKATNAAPGHAPSPFEGGRGDDSQYSIPNTQDYPRFILNRRHAFLLIDLLKDRIKEYCDGPIEPVGEYPAGDFLIKQIEIKATPIIESDLQECPRKPSGGPGRVALQLGHNLLTKNLGKRYKLEYLPGKSGIKFNYMGCPTVIHFAKAAVSNQPSAASSPARQAERNEAERSEVEAPHS